MLLHDYANTFLEICQDDGNSVGELAQKRLALTNHLLPFFGNVDLNTVNASSIRAYTKEKLAEEYAPKTINNHLLVLSRVMHLGREDGTITAAPFKIRLQTIQQDEARYLRTSEMHQLLAAALDDHDATWHAMMIFALHTGLRIGELLALDWTRVDFDKCTVTVDRSYCRVSQSVKSTKNGKRRVVSLNSQAMAALATLTHRDGTVWGVDYAMAYAAINRIAKAANLEGVGWHTLRHTFATTLVLANVPLFVVSRMLGHSGMKITERYAHLSPEKNRDAVSILSLALAS